MAKPVPPEGRWRSFSVSLREKVLEHLDEVRGDMPRSEWARVVIEAALGVLKSQEPVQIGGVRIGVTVDERQPAGVVTVASSGSVEAFALAPEPPPPAKAAKRAPRPRKAPTAAALAQDRLRDASGTPGRTRSLL